MSDITAGAQVSKEFAKQNEIRRQLVGSVKNAANTAAASIAERADHSSPARQTRPGANAGPVFSLDQVARDPLVAAVLKRFPGASVVAVRQHRIKL